MKSTLLDLELQVLYRPGRLHIVTYMLSRLTDPGDESGPVDDEVPTLEDNELVLVTTRSRRKKQSYAPPSLELQEHSTPRKSKQRGASCGES